MSPQVRGTAFGLILGCALSASAPARAESTAYDALGRVVSVTADNGKQTLYSYDAAGNRTTVATSATGVIQPPKAVDDIRSFTYGSAPNKTYFPLVNDSDPNPNNLTLTIVGVAPPQFGSMTFTGTSVTYTPPAAHIGAVDAFAYTIKNSASDTLTASAVIKITLLNPAPIANPDAVTTSQDTAVRFDPTINDTDPSGALPLTVTALGTPAHGTAVINATGKPVTYTPAYLYWGPDSFSYTIANTAGVTASSTIAVTVTAAAPTANPDTAVTSKNTPVTFDPTVNDTDPGSLPLSTAAVDTPLHGTAAVNSGGASVTYTPATNYTGPDSFGYTVANSGGGTASSSVAVTVTPPGDLAATVSAPAWNWTQYGTLPPHVQNPVVVTPSGGQAPYAYAWLYVPNSGDTAITPTLPTSNSTKWSRAMPDFATFTALWYCQVTDAAGHTANTPNVTVKFDKEDSQ